MSTPYIFLVAIATATIAAGCDFVQWSGPSPAQDPSNWQQIAYKHDVLGRRVEKKVDGYSTRYVYDGPHVIAEYDGNNNLRRKYIYGPGMKQIRNPKPATRDNIKIQIPIRHKSTIANRKYG